MAINKASNKLKIGEVTKEITQVPDKDRAMMDITVKIISGIASGGQVEEEVEVEDLGPITPILVDNPQIKTLNVGEEEIKIGEGDMDIIHNTINCQYMSKVITHPRGNMLI